MIQQVALAPHVLVRTPSTPRREIPRRMTPAHPGAVILPAALAVAGTALGAATTSALVGAASGARLGAASLATVALLFAYVARVVLAGRRRPVLARATSVAAAALAVLGAGALGFAPEGGLPALASMALLPALAVELAARGRRNLLRTHLRRVSLVAPSEMAAEEAIRRLENVPGLEIRSVVIPGCDVERAIRMLERPVGRTVGGRMRLEPEVVISCPRRDANVASAIAQLVALGHTVTSESATMQGAEGRVDVARAHPLNLLLARRPAPVSDALRRGVDVVGSALLLLLLSPVFLVAAVATWLDSGFPIFYRQSRVGRRGRLFPVIKFRTMRPDAEEQSGPVFATTDDPRVTAVGRVLRRYRVDELPQLVNVLLGSMTLVGPRPERPHFFNVLRQDVPLFELRTCVKPGVTGWAQIRLPYTAESDEARMKLEYDLYYVTHQNLLFDLAILLETVGVALTGAGAR